MGPFSHTAISRRVREADLALVLGAQLTDMNLGATKSQISTEQAVWALGHCVNISYHQYTDVTLRDFVRELAGESLPRFREKVRYYDNLKRTEPKPARAGKPTRLSVNDLLVEINEFLAAHRGYHVVAEAGDMLFGGLELRLQGGGLYLAQGYYASMGFGIPAAMGVQIGTGVRPLVVMGDGAFQMTGHEISHAPAKGLSPIVVLVNNAGWGIFRPVSPRHDLLEIPPWPYAELAQSWGGVGFRVDTREELRKVLRAAHEVTEFVLIECRVPENDLSPITRRFIRKSVSQARKKA
jgi:indolepyruvate decarboxylase